MRQVVLAIIVSALLVGVFWSLWYVLSNPRRRTTRISAELSAPVAQRASPLVVRYNRWQSAGAAVFFGLFAGEGALKVSDAALAVALVGWFGVTALWFARNALQDRPVLVISDAGVAVPRRQRNLAWSDIETIAIEENARVFGLEGHTLVLHLAPQAIDAPRHEFLGGVITTETEKVTVSLDLLSPSWSEIAKAIRALSSRQPVLPRKYTRVTN
jgi:hypothetical protein